MRNRDDELHATGRALFVGDEATSADTLYAVPLCSPVARGSITKLMLDDARALPGVKAVLTHEDIPGRNDIGHVSPDEVLLAESEVVYRGQPIAIIVATSAHIARAARDLCAVTVQAHPGVFDARQAAAQGMHMAPPRSFACGDVDSQWQQCDVVVEGRADTGAQEHLYLETQIAIAHPLEHNHVRIKSATQGPSNVQSVVARVLGCSMHCVDVEVMRLGGGFGGKEEQANPWAAMAALAAVKLGKPVVVQLSREDDLHSTGKRHPYSADFKLGLKSDGTMVAYQVKFFQNAGAFPDLSLAILERTLFHASNSYAIDHVHATATSCRTNLAPNTAFRGFGGPQAMFVLEAAIAEAARHMQCEPSHIQEKNLLRDGDIMPYGMPVANCSLHACWQAMDEKFALDQQRQRIAEFNAENQWQKKALATMPVTFGISFTTKFLNQADALVHIYNDGSVSVSCGAVEMGQGVKRKIALVAAKVLGIGLDRIKVESTRTTRVANMSPTAASTGADLNGQATRIACEQLVDRLTSFAAEHLQAPNPLSIVDEQLMSGSDSTGIGWADLVHKAYMNRQGLSAQAHYATPDLHFDKSCERGSPFAYHVFGCAAVEVTLDCLRGRYTIDAVKVVHDCGQSLAPEIDQGQIEGGVVQGIGWMTMEEVRHDTEGRLLSGSLTAYKIPDIYAAPEIEVHMLPGTHNAKGLLHSKAVGEPPLMYGIAAYFALNSAIQAFRSDCVPAYEAPLTPERALLALYPRS